MRKTQVAVQVLDVVEACYRLDLDEPQWLENIVTAATPLLDAGLGVTSYTYDASDQRQVRMLDACLPKGVDPAALAGYLASVPADFVARTWLARPCGYASRFDGFDELAPALAAFGGARDVLAVNGRDPTGVGVWLGALLLKPGRASDSTLEPLGKLAAHLASAFRIRRRLGPNGDVTAEADAVLRPDGKLEHATGDATVGERRATLRRAAVDLDKARSARGRKEPERALAWWKSMVDARWTLLDHFDNDGRHYVIARRNDSQLRAIDDLTDREREVLAYAALGHGNKVIAYELGLAAATVRVLLHRCSKKLGVRTRAQLVARWLEATRQR